MPRVWDAGVVDEPQLRAIAARFAGAARGGGVIYLEGDLGAGKTTFARALLGALGVGERIKSPTYSLIESYRAGDVDAHHLDLYRIADAGELEWLGLGDLWTPGALVLIEWPERGAGALPPADLIVHLRHAGERRGFVAEPRSALGETLVAAVSDGVETSLRPHE
jgi:tRNA threonylcarbamoyladenosine biosynthesis protein TsaE